MEQEKDFAKIKKISYIGVVCDLFHYGHLRSINFSKSLSDYNICGVFSDEAVEEYRVRPIANLEERKAVVESLNCVDEIMIQNTRDPTENLKRIHEKFPDAEIILVHGDDLSYVYGSEYVKSIGGKVVKHSYYTRLSNFKIINYILENKDKFKDITKFSSMIKEIKDKDKPTLLNKTIISTKADTLRALKPLLKRSSIEKIYAFTFSDWKTNKDLILSEITQNYPYGKIVARSSAINEDTLDNSMAGYFESVLNIDVSNKREIENSINKVFNSYKNKDSESSFNQVLIQKQTENILMSGVIFTRTLTNNAPYYVINYDDKTGSTDSVTAGRESQSMVISHFTEKIPSKMQRLIQSVKEIEEILPHLPLDIEFSINSNNQVIIFQVRPLAANIHKDKIDEEIQRKIVSLKEEFRNHSYRKQHLAGATTFFADMPDWNPAEIIGNNPNPLDHSLYDYIITNNAWHEARTSQGYFNVNPAKLVELFGNKPFVNVRNTFNSFTPQAVSPQLREKLVDFYLKKLERNPHLQDKVEFEILFTCYDLNFSKRAQELRENGFNEEELDELKNALLGLTNNLVKNSPISIKEDINTILSMEVQRKELLSPLEKEPQELLNKAKILLDDCRRKGTVQFSRMARLGFIAKIIVKSLVNKGIINQQFYDSLFSSISTIATKISEDFNKFCNNEISREEFLKDYYHLRPGTYDITSLRYDANPSLLQNSFATNSTSKKSDFQLSSEEEINITNELRKEGLDFNATEFITFLKEATEARELAKFEFTKNLSDSLELISQAGEELGFTRKEIALLSLEDVFCHENKIESWKKAILKSEKNRMLNQKINLPSIIFSENDFDVIKHYSAKPNFITQKSVHSKIVSLTNMDNNNVPELEGKIVIIENGDPGFDWIFTRNPAGLITKYGGVASHMSIRCAEFGIPAAIGCGELIFNKINNAESVLLDCKQNKIIPGGKI